MFKSITRSLRFLFIAIILLITVYVSYHYLDPSITTIYRGHAAIRHAARSIIYNNVMVQPETTSKLNGTLFENCEESHCTSSLVSSRGEPRSRLYLPDQSDINIYFTVKTTPENYEKRIRPLQISWFQKVNKNMFSIVSDQPQENIKKDSKVKQFEARLIKEGFKVALSNCPIKYGRKTLCCKAGLEFEQYYQYIEKHKGNRDNWPQWFCHFDDDVYVNVEQLKRLLHQYDPLKSYYVGRHWRTEYGLTVNTNRLNQFKKIFHIKSERRKFWHAAGPTYCLSYPLMMELKDFFNGSQRFLRTCNTTRYADDLTVGAIIGVVLGYNITHTTEFDYDHIDLRFASTETITKMATINYKYNKETGKIWRSKINEKLRIFSDEVDPPGVLSLHCLLYNDTRWCPSKSNSISSLDIPVFAGLLHK